MNSVGSVLPSLPFRFWLRNSRRTMHFHCSCNNQHTGTITITEPKEKTGSSGVRTERLAHHLKFLKTCQEKSIIPQGLLLDKTINPIKTHSKACVNSLHIQIKEILANASEQIWPNLSHITTMLLLKNKTYYSLLTMNWPSWRSSPRKWLTWMASKQIFRIKMRTSEPS